MRFPKIRKLTHHVVEEVVRRVDEMTENKAKTHSILYESFLLTVQAQGTKITSVSAYLRIDGPNEDLAKEIVGANEIEIPESGPRFKLICVLRVSDHEEIEKRKNSRTVDLLVDENLVAAKHDGETLNWSGIDSDDRKRMIRNSEIREFVIGERDLDALIERGVTMMMTIIDLQVSIHS